MSILSQYNHIIDQDVRNSLIYLFTTILCVSFQFSLSESVPMSGFNVCRLTPATFVPLHTGTETQIETLLSNVRHDSDNFSLVQRADKNTHATNPHHWCLHVLPGSIH